MKQTLVLLLLFLSISVSLFPADALRNYLDAQTQYWGIHEKISSADLDQLVDLKRKADQSGLTSEERTKAYTDLFHFVQKLRGFPEGKVPAAMAASVWTEGESPIPPALASAKAGQLGNHVKRGAGKIPMVLIPDIGADLSIFESFMQRNQTQFAFYAVTLPGFGGTNPPLAHGTLDFGALKWWNNANAAMLDLLSKQKIKRPFVLGHQAGAYLAMRLALQHPELIRGVVVLNGLLYAPVPGIPQNASIAERARFVNSLIPAELFPHPSASHYFEAMKQGGAWFCKNKQRQDELTRLVTRSDPRIWWNYFAELATTDLSGELKSLKVPMLVLPSMYDRDLPGGPEMGKSTLEQWNPFERGKSSLPITITTMDDCRAYATEDQPAKLDQVIGSWAAAL